MTQIKYWVVDPSIVHTRLDAEGQETKVSFFTRDVICTQILDENEVFTPPVWVRHGIEVKGWRVLTKPLPPSGLNDMVSVNWRSVANDLADVVEALLEQEDMSDQGPSAAAGIAMDNYRIAQHEEGLRRGPDIEEMDDPDEQ